MRGARSASLNAAGKLATVDVLGEEITRRRRPRRSRRPTSTCSPRSRRDGLDSNVRQADRARPRARPGPLPRQPRGGRARRGGTRLLRAHRHGGLETTDETLRIYRELREVGLDNLGVVLQAYLRRTVDDVRALSDLQPNVRSARGSTSSRPGSRSRSSKRSGPTTSRRSTPCSAAGCYVGIATHDEWLVARPRSRRVAASSRRTTSSRCCSASASGARPSSSRPATGSRLRPVRERWYEYSLRRLQENPKLAGYARATC